MKKANPEDFSNFIKEGEKSRKDKLIEECKRLDVSLYIDDQSENSKGNYSGIRAVASEAELERRIIAKKASISSMQSKYIAIIALIISLISLVKSFL